METSKKKSVVSKRGRPATGHKLQGTAERFHRQYPGQEPLIVEHSGPIEDSIAEESPSTELSDHKFPPPKKHPTFQKVWFQSIDSITNRENFKVTHLNTLEILCDLFAEYDELTTFIRKNGRSYKSVGRSGIVWRFYPEVGQIKSVQAQIRDYTKLLGLLLKKDNSIESGAETDNWD
jgi:hypothetical protein